MVLGVLTAVAACPAIVGVNETVQHGQRQNAKERHRGRKSNLVVSCNDRSRKSKEIDGCYIVLRDNNVRYFPFIFFEIAHLSELQALCLNTFFE